jgi:hypothetical protein
MDNSRKNTLSSRIPGFLSGISKNRRITQAPNSRINIVRPYISQASLSLAPASASASSSSSSRSSVAKYQYPSKFLAMYYIDIINEFIDVIYNCSIHILSAINRNDFIMIQQHFNNRVLNRFPILMNNISDNRYNYVSRSVNKSRIFNIETEVKHIEFFLREKFIGSFTNLETCSYYIGLRHVWKSLGYKNQGITIAKKQFAHISTILKNTQLTEKKKLKEILKYTTNENKVLVQKVEETTSINMVSLESVEAKLKYLEEKIETFEKDIDQNIWTSNGKRLFEYYLENLKKRESLGGKKRKALKRGGFDIRQLLGIRRKETRIVPVADEISQDYMAIVDIYKISHITKLYKIYDMIASIFNYSQYTLNIYYIAAKKEYGYLLKPEYGFDKRNLRDDEKQMLELLRKQEKIIQHQAVYDISHNFGILKNRKDELDKKIATYYTHFVV